MNIEQLAKEYFPKGYPVMAEQWLDFAEHVAEAQHRKTWALAMDKVCLEAFKIYGNTANCAKLRLPCPPIEATKDK